MMSHLPVAGRLSLRRYREEDLSEVVRIEQQAFGASAWPPEAFDGYELNPAALFFVAVRGGNICGYSLTWVRRGGAELYSLAVSAQARGRGVGRALLRRAIREATRAGAPVIWLTVRPSNLPAIDLYNKMGFRRTRLVRGYYEDGSDGLRMRFHFTAQDP